MIHEFDIVTTPAEAVSDIRLRRKAANKLHLSEKAINDLKIIRRSVDARKTPVKINLRLRIATGEDKELSPLLQPIILKKVNSESPTVVVVGAGPAGLFAALRALEKGIRPIVVERGKDVDARRLDITALSRSGKVHPESNYCFGEGGAGTFSDGKLFTRSKKRGNTTDVLQLLHHFGASSDILIESHPHIGSDKLPKVIKAIREAIIEHGGEVHFETKMTKLLFENQNNQDSIQYNDSKTPQRKFRRVIGIETDKGEKFYGPIVLATGHSARDVYRQLQSEGIKLEQKGFSMGVRLEHPQELIDRLQYHTPDGRGPYLPAAEYSYVCQVDGRGVYSFCMCPGGVIVPASSSEGEAVVNGMSASARASRWANSGMVVEIRPGDFPEYDKFGELALLELQSDMEKKFYEASGNTLNAPAQRMKDFTEGKASATLPATSYVCGIHPERLDLLLPPFIAKRLQSGFLNFGRKSNGFLTNDACLIGLESRTSSPVRIPRDPITLSHPEIDGLYPAGEGAGFAGGIVSAAVDGRRCIDAIFDNYFDTHL